MRSALRLQRKQQHQIRAYLEDVEYSLRGAPPIGWLRGRWRRIMPKRVATHERGKACEKVEGDVEVRSRLKLFLKKEGGPLYFFSFPSFAANKRRIRVRRLSNSRI
jgi:hypothetical protein